MEVGCVREKLEWVMPRPPTPSSRLHSWGDRLAKGPFLLSLLALAISFPLLFPTDFIHLLENILDWKVKNVPKHLKRSHLVVFQRVPHTPKFKNKACVLPPSNTAFLLHVDEEKFQRLIAGAVTSHWGKTLALVKVSSPVRHNPSFVKHKSKAHSWQQQDWENPGSTSFHIFLNGNLRSLHGISDTTMPGFFSAIVS